jgi:pimeloyl-ACP methyl ester carboxylesterase
MITDKIILYSHGFGVQKDDRGLFTDIANELNNSKHVMFDYNQIDEDTNTLTVTPLQEQAEMLKRQYNALRSKYPDARIDLVCHSQGCVVAGLTKLNDIRKIILLAPPTRFLGSEAKLKQMSEREGTLIKDGVVSYPRRDGSTTIIKQDYWQSRDKITDPIALYNELSENTETIIVNALNDEVLGETDYSTLSEKVSLIEQEANHDFTGEARSNLLKSIRDILG